MPMATSAQPRASGPALNARAAQSAVARTSATRCTCLEKIPWTPASGKASACSSYTSTQTIARAYRPRTIGGGGRRDSVTPQKSAACRRSFRTDSASASLGLELGDLQPDGEGLDDV